MRVLYLAGDESGSLADPYTHIFTMAMIMTHEPEALRWIIPRVKRQVPRALPKNEREAEFKFRNTSSLARATVLSELSKQDVKITSVSIYKGSQIIENTPENYGLVLCTLLRHCIFPAQTNVQIFFDRHFIKTSQQDIIHEMVKGHMKLKETVNFVDSKQNYLVQLADFVAGAVHSDKTSNNAIFYNFLRPILVGDELITWKTARREWFEHPPFKNQTTEPSRGLHGQPRRPANLLLELLCRGTTILANSLFEVNSRNVDM